MDISPVESPPSFSVPPVIPTSAPAHQDRIMYDGDNEGDDEELQKALLNSLAEYGPKASPNTVSSHTAPARKVAHQVSDLTIKVYACGERMNSREYCSLLYMELMPSAHF